MDDSVSYCWIDLPFLTDTLFRKVLEEVDGEHRHRG
jgi:hypothetical protein